MQKPEKGFYYHFKHNPEDVFDHAYEVVGVGRHTETEGLLVLYRPLYKLDFLENADVCVRPLEMFNDVVDRDGKSYQRFQKITDPEIVKKLVEKRAEMYK